MLILTWPTARATERLWSSGEIVSLTSGVPTETSNWTSVCSTATASEVEKFYDIEDVAFTDDEFLKFNLKGLAELAKSKDDKRRSWLSDFLQDIPDTAESRQLKALLAAH